MKIEYIEFINESLIEEWKSLWDSSVCAHFFNSYVWFQICSEVYPDLKPVIICIRHKNKLKALLPLVLVKKFGISFYTNPGGLFVDRSALLIDKYETATINTLFNALKAKGSFVLTEVPEDLASLFSQRGIEKLETGVNLQLPFENNPFRFVKSKNMRKIKKVYEEYGRDISFEMNRGSVQSLKIAMKIDRISYRQKKNIGTFNNPLNRAFFASLVKNGRDNIGMNVLYYKKKPIAYEIGVRSGKIYHGINKSFNNSYAFLTPGKILAYSLFEGLHKEGMELFDFSRGDDMLKRSFTSISKMQYDIYYTNNLAARILLVNLSKLRKKLVSNRLFYSNYRKLVSLKK